MQVLSSTPAVRHANAIRPCNRHDSAAVHGRTVRAHRRQSAPAAFVCKGASGSSLASVLSARTRQPPLRATAGECNESGERKTKLILYSKPGCHLCEGLEEKLKEAIAAKVLRIVEEIDVRDISTNTEWWSAYQLEVPVMAVDVEGEEKQIPRQSPRLSAERVGQAVQKAIEALLGPTTHKADDAAGGKDSGGGGGGDPYTLQPVNWRK